MAYAVRKPGSRGLCPRRDQRRAGVHQVREPAKLIALHDCQNWGARCVDDLSRRGPLGRAQKHGTQIECLVEIDCGAGRCA